jgi:hypothetical protein
MKSEVNEVSEVTLEEAASRIEKLERVTVDVQDKCFLCGYVGRMDWEVTFHDGTWGTLCQECGDKLAEKL